MILIEPKVERWDIYTNSDKTIMENLWSHIARCTRVCYQSESKKNPSETDEEFVKRVILPHTPENNIANHLSMLEHSTVYLKIPASFYDGYQDCLYFDNNYSYVNEDYVNWELGLGDLYITTNLRVLIENNWLQDLQFATKPTQYHKKRVTFSFITDIGVSRELNRHRCHSIAEESTRYCNYTKGKFGNNITFVTPAWYHKKDELIPDKSTYNTDKIIANLVKDLYHNDDGKLFELWSDIDCYISALTFAEWHYKMLISYGWTPQQARQVLPLGTKTQVVHTAFVSDWMKFIKLRSDGISGAPHPNMKIIADKIKQLLIKDN